MKKLLAVGLGALMIGGLALTLAQAQTGPGIPLNYGGAYTFNGNASMLAIPAATATVVVTGRHQLMTICYTGSGTGGVAVNDTATTGGVAAGNVLVNPSSNTAGACVNYGLPVTNGIVVTFGSSTTGSVFYR